MGTRRASFQFTPLALPPVRGRCGIPTSAKVAPRRVILQRISAAITVAIFLFCLACCFSRKLEEKLLP